MNNRRKTSTNYKCQYCGKFYYISLSQTQCPCRPTTFEQSARALNSGFNRPGGLYLGNGLVVSPADAPKVAYTKFG